MVDVVIVGCGPVGALAANLLGRAGLQVTVLEKEAALFPLPRAVHIDHEMLRLMQSAGVIDRVETDMRDTDGHLHVGADHGVIRYMGTLGKPRPFGWSNDYFFYQPELEANLREGLADLDNVTLVIGAEVTGLQQDQDGVTLDYALNDQRQQIRARWVIAADGARSAVRKALNVPLDDLDFDEPWLVIDAAVDGPVRFPGLTGVPADADLQKLSVMMCDPARPATVVPGRGNHRRWEFMMLPGEDETAIVQPDTIARLLKPYLEGVPHRVERAATYHFHGLLAEQWQVGSVFLVGDAAHQTPPFFGQGMCHGFRDVANLAWKMEAVAHGHADPDILATYQLEREPHVRAVIGAAVNAGRYICMLDPNSAAERDAEMRARASSGRSETAADLIPPIKAGLVMADSKGAGERFIQPRLEDGRLLDDVTGQGCRLFARDASIGGRDPRIRRFDLTMLNDNGALADWLDAHEADAVLVRPDHYVFGTARNSAQLLFQCWNSALAPGGQAVQEKIA